MGYDFASLEPLITQILSAPGTDLETVSAKRVRRELSTLDPSLTQEFLKENKAEVDVVITRVYGRINTSRGEGSEELTAAPSNHKYEENEELDEPEEDDSSPPVAKPKKGKKKGDALTDAELARQLSSEINARSSRRSTGKGKANGTPKKSRSKKSAATVDSDDDESDGSGGRKKKSKRGGGAKGGFAKEYTLRLVFLFETLKPVLTPSSTPLATLLQAEKMSRPQVVKQLWEYIKKNERQNPSNKREIMCDDALKAVFNVEKIDMFKMNKILGQ